MVQVELCCLRAHIFTPSLLHVYHRDTVSSIGFFRGKLLPLIQECNHITYFRHALALDERRVKFLPEFVKPSQQQTENKHVKEVWFAGTHSDMLVPTTRFMRRIIDKFILAAAETKPT